MEEMLEKTNIRKNMKNYYEILEVDKNASKEVIEKAYRTLAKKYHPDLRSSTYSQERMMKINEAYEILSNDFKRKEYDNHLQSKSISIEEYNKIKQENIQLKNNLKKFSNQYSNNNTNEEDLGNTANFIRNLYKGITRKADTPVKTTPKKKIKLSKKTIQKIVAAVLVLIIISCILAIIPTTRQFFVNLYNENTVVNLIVNIFRDTFSKGF